MARATKHTIAAIIALILLAVAMTSAAEPETKTLYVICKPDSFVNVRAKPTKTASILGYRECGDAVETDGTRKGSYIHCINLSLEADDGWIHAGYLVEDPPSILEEETRYRNCSNGRVALRNYVDGKRRSWAKSGANLTVLVMSDDWSLTTRGFIKTEYLEADPE